MSASTEPGCDLLSTCWLDGFNKNQGSSDLRISLVIWFFIVLVCIAGILIMLFLVQFHYPGSSSSSGLAFAPQVQAQLKASGIQEEEIPLPQESTVTSEESTVAPEETTVTSEETTVAALEIIPDSSFVSEKIGQTPEFHPVNPFESTKGVPLFDDEAQIHNPDLKADSAHQAAHVETAAIDDEFPPLDSDAEEPFVEPQ
jgi:hypothetical protein